MNQGLEQVLFHYILKNPDLAEKCKPEFFSISYIRELFAILKPYVLQYQSYPKVEQAIELVRVSEISDEVKQYLTPDTMRTFWNVNDTIASYDDDWLMNSVKAFLSWQTLMTGFRHAVTYIKTVQSDVTIDNYEDLVNTARTILSQQTIVDFNDTGAGLDIYNPENHKTKQLQRFQSGYDFIDYCSKGGYWPGSLWVFLGAPKAGKSRLLQNLCAQSMKMGYDCAYISLELQEEIILQRMGANLFDINIDHYDDVANDEVLMRTKISDFQNRMIGVKPGQLDVKTFPTSATSVSEVETWLLKEEERISLVLKKPFKFKNVFIDYINILKNSRNPNSENTYMKIKQIAEDLRAMGQRNGWCIITATQTKQNSWNTGDIDMSGAAESSALAATVDMMFGIITDVMMNANHECFIKILANRVNGKVNERKRFIIDEDHMRLSEDMTATIIKDEDLQDFVRKSKEILKNSSQFASKPTVQSAPLQVAPQLDITENHIMENNIFQNDFTGKGIFGG